MYTVDDLLAAAAVAGFPTMCDEVLVDTGRLAVAVTVQVHGEIAVLRLRPIQPLPSRYGLLLTCPARRCVAVLRAVRRILQGPRGSLAGLFEERRDAPDG